MKQTTKKKTNILPSITKARWMLVLYDALLYVAMAIPLLRYIDSQHTWGQTMAHVGLSLVVILVLRFAWRVYNQIWRYGGVTTYMGLMLADACATFTYYTILKLCLESFSLFLRTMAGQNKQECPLEHKR